MPTTVRALEKSCSIGPKPRRSFKIVDIDMPVVDLVAALPQEIADHVLARPFRAAGRGNRDKIPCGRKLRVEIGVDGVEDLFAWYRWRSFASLFLCRLANAPDQTILCLTLQTF